MTKFLQSDQDKPPLIKENKNADSLSQIRAFHIWSDDKPLRIHLGCGEHHLEGYVNFDQPPSEHTVQNKVAADCFADIPTLCFPDNSVDEIRLHHVFEHFNRSVALAMLISWHRWLKPDGILYIETPDLMGSAKTLLSDASWLTKMSVIRHIAGSHEASWAYHIDQWFPERFERTLTNLGYGIVNITSSSWTNAPFLSNVSVIAKKQEDVPLDRLIQAGDKILWESTVSITEKAMHGVWTNELRKSLRCRGGEAFAETIESNSRNRGNGRSGDEQKFIVVIFSKDRAMQLDCTLRSFFKHCWDPDDVLVTVLYNASTAADENQYHTLSQEYATVAFHTEVDFKIDLLSLLRGHKCVLFVVDDNIFVSEFSIRDITDCLHRHPDALGFSLRLGRNTTYCYMGDKQQALPSFLPPEKSVLKYVWPIAELDFAYPLELSSSLYRSADIVPFFERIDFKNPNTLELAMEMNKSSFAHTKSGLLCFERSVAFCNPVNMVQTMWTNRSGRSAAYSAEKLSELFSQGYRIQADRFAGFIPRSCHQEVDFEFSRDHASSTFSSKISTSTSPLVTIGIANYNGIQHIQPCLESIRRNTQEPYEVIVVDNGSTDGSREYLRKQMDIILIENLENIGAPGARNQFLSLALGDYIVFLDNDTIVTRDWIKKLINHMDSDTIIGIIGACSNYATGLQGIPNVSYNTVEELEEYSRKRAEQHKGELVLSPRLISFCVFIRKSAIEKVGGMETGFSKFCFEDDDYSIRISIGGYKSVVANDVFIHHTGGPQGRGDKQYNKWLIDAWNGFKGKWGLPENLPFGSSYDLKKLVDQPFDPEKHFLPLPDKEKTKKLIYQNRTDVHDKETTPINTTSQITSGLISIIIPVSNFNAKLRRCLDSIETRIKEPHEIILTANGALSKPAWLNNYINKNSQVKMIGVPKKTNYADRLNKALEKIHGQYVLILDPCTVLLEGTLGRMLECLSRNPKYGITVPTLNQAIGSQQIPGTQSMPFRDFEKYSENYNERNRYRAVITSEIDSSGVLIDRPVITAVGLFNRKISTPYHVINDYRLRSLVKGYQTVITGDSCIYLDQDDLRKRGSDTVFHDQWDIFDPQSEIGVKLSPYVALKNARDYFSQGFFEKSIQAIIDGIKVTPDEEELYYGLAEILFQKKSFQETIEAIKAMPEAGQNQARTLEIIGYCSYYLGRIEEAEDYANRAIFLSNDSAKALNLKGLTALKREERKTAEDLFYQAIDVNPCLADAYVNLGVMKWHTDEKEEGFSLIEKGFILSPEKGDFSTTYHSAVTALNQFSRAEKIVMEAVGLFPKNKTLTFLFIDILVQQNKESEAMAEIEKALVAFGLDQAILSAANSLREKIGPLIIDPQKNRGTLSVCMIVKNEACHLVRCLASLKPVADEIVIVDTGSTDQTKEIAAAFGAQIHDFPWTNDFSEARNVSLEKAKGDWILVHDADEVLSPLNYDNLKQLLCQKHQKPVAYELITRNYIMEPAIDGWTANVGEYREEESGSGWFPSNKVRLFRRDPRIRFCNPVHEIVEPSIIKAGMEIRTCSIPIHHYGKLPTETNMKKGDTYYLLGKKKLENMSNIPMAHREMAIQAEELGKHAEAIKHWQAYARAIPDNALPHFNMASIYLEMGEFGRALESAQKACDLDPHAKETILTYATVSMCAGDPFMAVIKLETLLEKIQNYPPAQVALAAGYCLTGRKEQGITLMKQMKRKGYNYDPAMESLSKKLILAGRSEFSIPLLEGMLEWDAEKQTTLALLNACRVKPAQDLSLSG